MSLSGTSAGAMNAVALSCGLLDGGCAGARRKLSEFWGAVSSVPVPVAADPFLAPGLLAGGGFPLSCGSLRNPLREIAGDLFDFARLRRELYPVAGIRIYVNATNARTGEGRIFGNEDLDLDVLLASACLPDLFPAIEIGGESYWDGAFSANPPLLPLVRDGRCGRILLVELDGIRRSGEVPVGPGAAVWGRSLFFSLSLRNELRLLEASCDEPPPLCRIAMPEDDLWCDPETRMFTSRPFLEALFRAGRERSGWFPGAD